MIISRCSSRWSLRSVEFLRHHVRWLILAISLVILTFANANILTFNFAVICMFRPEKQQPNTTTTTAATTNMVDDPKESFYHDYSSRQRDALFSAPAIGSVLNSLFVPYLIGLFGSRVVFTAYSAISALSCLLMPLAVQIGIVPLFLLRMSQGMLYPVELILLGQVSKEWSPLGTITIYLIILSAHYQLGPLFTMPISGLLCESRFGWPAIYYLLGLLTLAISALFFLIYRRSPSQHPWISNKELRLIQADKSSIGVQTDVDAKNGEKMNVPYRQMLADPIIWIVLLTFWTDDLGFQVFIQYGPVYLNRVLGMDVTKTGFLAALPLLLSMFAKFLAGPINDRLPWKEERIRINIFSALNEIGMIVTFIMLAILPMVEGMPEWAIQVVYASVNIFSGLDFLGVIKCSQHITQQFSSTIMAWYSMISSATILLLPVVVGFAAPNNSVVEWAYILFGVSALQMVTIVLFLFFCDSKPRPWTLQKDEGCMEGGGIDKKKIMPISKY